MVAPLIGLNLLQPIKGAQTHFQHLAVGKPLPGQQQGLWQPGVVVGQDIFTPGPVFGGEIPELLHEPVRKYFTHPSRTAVPAVAAQIRMNANDGEGDRPRVGEMFEGIQRTMEQVGRINHLPLFPTQRHSNAQSPHCATV